MADHAHTTPPPGLLRPRRSFFAAASALALATPAKAAENNSDGRLIAMCAEFDALERRSQDVVNAASTKAEEDEADVIVSEMFRLQGSLLDAICALPLTTMAGAAAIAASLDLAGGSADDFERRLRGSLIHGLLAGSVQA